eukprot:740515-Lingulodinium_polyedra.AAC.1
MVMVVMVVIVVVAVTAVMSAVTTVAVMSSPSTSNHTLSHDVRPWHFSHSNAATFLLATSLAMALAMCISWPSLNIFFKIWWSVRL